jgi:hypothetical protein
MKHTLLFCLAAFCVLVAFLSLSCSRNAKNKTLSQKSLDSDVESIKESEQLSDEDMRLLTSYVSRLKISMEVRGTPFPEDKTVGQMIDEQRTWEDNLTAKRADSDRRAEVAAKEDTVVADQLRRVVQVEVYNKRLSKADSRLNQYDDYLLFGCVIRNLGSRNINRFMGSLVFSDRANKEISRTTLLYDKLLLPGKSIDWVLKKKYNDFIDGDVKLANTDLQEMRVAWMPQTIIYNDSTRVGRE